MKLNLYSPRLAMISLVSMLGALVFFAVTIIISYKYDVRLVGDRLQDTIYSLEERLNNVIYQSGVVKADELVQFLGQLKGKNQSERLLLIESLGVENLSIGTSLVKIFEDIEQGKIGATGGVALFDQKTKETLADSGSHFLFAEKIAPKLGLLGRFLTINDLELTNGDQYLISVSRLKIGDLRLVVFQEKSEAMVGFYRWLLLLIALFIGILGLIYLASLWIIGSKNLPIEPPCPEEAAKGPIEALVRAKAGAAHELRNPLNIITNSSLVIRDLIESTSMGLERAEGMDQIKSDLEVIKNTNLMIQKHTRRANQIISNFLSQCNESGKSLTMENIDEVVCEAVRLVMAGEQSGRYDGVQIRTNLSVGMKSRLNKEELTRAFVNIIHNSMDALEEKTKSTEKFEGDIEIATHVLEDSSIVVRFVDNGPGVSPDVRNQMVEPFFTTKPSNRGTGLGLALVNRAITRHRGKMKIESDLGKGTSVIISLPVSN